MKGKRRVLVVFGKHDHTPILEICECVPLHGKWVLAEIMRSRMLTWEVHTVLAK